MDYSTAGVIMLACLFVCLLVLVLDSLFFNHTKDSNNKTEQRVVSIINIQLVVLSPVHLSESIQLKFLKKRTVSWQRLRTWTSN